MFVFLYAIREFDGRLSVCGQSELCRDGDYIIEQDFTDDRAPARSVAGLIR